MDPKGAHLRRRLDSHAQWQRARRPEWRAAAADPEPPELIEFDEGVVRRYRDGLCKRLADGRWIAALAGDIAI